MDEMKLRKILRNIKSKNPQKRFEAIQDLFQFKLKTGIEIQIDVLKDCVKTAASTFPESLDQWDHPSFYLIDFVCDFPNNELYDSIMKHFDGFHIYAKERVIPYLLATEREDIFYFIIEKIIQLIQ